MRLFGYALMALSLTLASCSKDGDDGLDGAMGSQGEQGIPGTDGEDGEDGNANVIASAWFGPDGQTFVTNGYTRYAEFNVDISSIDPNLLDSGTLLVYAKFSTFVQEVYPSEHISRLPLTISGGTTDHIFTNYFSADNLKIRYRQEGPAATWEFSASSQFRYVLVPSGLSSKSNLNVSKMTYEEVVAHFNLDY